MQKSIKIYLLLIFSLTLVACNNSVERANRTVTMLQDCITSIVNELNEIQVAENNLQTEFESTLNSTEDLSAFISDDSPVHQNISRRKEHLNNLVSQMEELEKLSEEFSKQAADSPLPEVHIKEQVTLVQDLLVNLSTYREDYQANLETESIIYKSIANPETNFESFFSVFDKVQILHTTNQINLEKVLGFFEPINAQLINFKVYLVNLEEA